MNTQVLLDLREQALTQGIFKTYCELFLLVYKAFLKTICDGSEYLCRVRDKFELYSGFQLYLDVTKAQRAIQ